MGKVISQHDVGNCKKTDPEAKPAVLIEGFKVSSVRWVKPHPGVQKPTTLDKAEGPKSMKIRREELYGVRVKMVLDVLIDALSEKRPVSECYTLPYLASMICVFGGDGRPYSGAECFADVLTLTEGDTIPAFIDYEHTEEKLDCRAILWRKLIGNMQNICRVSTGAHATAQEEEAREVAKVIGFNFDKSFEVACQEKPEPKSWANLNEDGTSKTGKGK
jgi:hypothetical protein